MTEQSLNMSVCPQKEPVVYFDYYCDIVKYASVIPSASANIAYFEPNLQKWALVDHEK